MLDATREGRIASALTAFGDFCSSDEELSTAIVGEPFLQGSVATRTAIKPLLSDEFDVDVVYPFSLKVFRLEDRDAGRLVRWFKSRLEKNEFYARRLKPKDRCARIDYAGDFHMDLIPATRDEPNHQPYAVPSRDLGDWIATNPLAFADWVRRKDANGAGQDSKGDGYFVRSVRFMKRWRDQFFTLENAPSSMLLTTVLGKHDPAVKYYSPELQGALFPEFQHDAAYLFDLLRLTSSCLHETNRRSDAFDNPTLRGENLGGGWESKHLVGFLALLETCISHLREGIWADDQSKSVEHFRRAFGDTFPAA